MKTSTPTAGMMSGWISIMWARPNNWHFNRLTQAKLSKLQFLDDGMPMYQSVSEQTQINPHSLEYWCLLPSLRMSLQEARAMQASDSDLLGFDLQALKVHLYGLDRHLLDKWLSRLVAFQLGFPWCKSEKVSYFPIFWQIWNSVAGLPVLVSTIWLLRNFRPLMLELPFPRPSEL